MNGMALGESLSRAFGVHSDYRYLTGGYLLLVEHKSV